MDCTVTSGRASRRHRSGAQRPRHEDGAPTFAEVTADERAVLEQLRYERDVDGDQPLLLTLPGCDRPEHRAHIFALMQAVAGGHPSATGGFYRMRCGCALLVHGRMTVEWS